MSKDTLICFVHLWSAQQHLNTKHDSMFEPRGNTFVSRLKMRLSPAFALPPGQRIWDGDTSGFDKRITLATHFRPGLRVEVTQTW